MQPYAKSQNAALLLLRIIIAIIFYVAAYAKFPFWSSAPPGMSHFLLFTTKLLSIVEPLGATAVLFGFLTRRFENIVSRQSGIKNDATMIFKRRK